MRVHLIACGLALCALVPAPSSAQPRLHLAPDVTNPSLLVQDREERREHRAMCRRERAEIDRERQHERAERRAGHREEAREIHARVMHMREEYREHCPR